jgi:carnitine 3-dehydrogenase
MSTPITRVAIIGAGVIGASWATAFLARGIDVVASDPAPGAEEALRKTVDAQWPAMQQIGLSPTASTQRLRFAASPEDAVVDAGFVQESGPERLEIKLDLFRRLDEAAPPDALLATSTSTITISEFQDACTQHPERVVLGHPFNPPHLIPLVEVGGQTDRARCDRTSLELLSRDGQVPNPFAPRDHGPCRQPPAGGAVAGGVQPREGGGRQRR